MAGTQGPHQHGADRRTGRPRRGRERQLERCLRSGRTRHHHASRRPLAPTTNNRTGSEAEQNEKCVTYVVGLKCYLCSRLLTSAASGRVGIPSLRTTPPRLTAFRRPSPSGRDKKEAQIISAYTLRIFSTTRDQSQFSRTSCAPARAIRARKGASLVRRRMA